MVFAPDFTCFFCLLLSCQQEEGIKKERVSFFTWYLNLTLLAFFPGVLLSFLDLLFLSIAKLDTVQCRIFPSVNKNIDNNAQNKI